MKSIRQSKGPLTARQEAFAQRLAVGDSQADAYREAGFKSDNAGTIYAMSSKLASDLRIRQRVDALRAMVDRARAATQVVTAASATAMLEEVYRRALVDKQHGAAATAVMGIAKLNGLLVDKVEDVTRRAASSPDAPREIDLDDWLTMTREATPEDASMGLALPGPAGPAPRAEGEPEVPAALPPEPLPEPPVDPAHAGHGGPMPEAHDGRVPEAGPEGSGPEGREGLASPTPRGRLQ